MAVKVARRDPIEELGLWTALLLILAPVALVYALIFAWFAGWL